ncbi:hypothetical protein AVEN_25513-1 [Araneus ventricosus]|uniref:Uncharacterized protein n=1 Tax=Araneus ventricosus TaxID=182803 RepID=A0A4Y2U762_ARAVE|nr:hypothetical protein AVEN_25513-1 [Araneus ventricosus]
MTPCVVPCTWDARPAVQGEIVVTLFYEVSGGLVVRATALYFYERGFDPLLGGVRSFVTILHRNRPRHFVKSGTDGSLKMRNQANGPYAPFGFESIEKQLWRNKQNDRPVRDSEIKAVLSQLFKTDQWQPPAGHVSEDVTTHA